MFSITRGQAPGEIPNKNLQNFLNVSLKRDVVRPNSNEGIRLDFTKNLTSREYSFLKARLNLNEWYFLVASFDFENKQAYFSLVDFENTGRNKVFELSRSLALDLDVPQMFGFGNFFYVGFP